MIESGKLLRRLPKQLVMNERDSSEQFPARIVEGDFLLADEHQSGEVLADESLAGEVPIAQKNVAGDRREVLGPQSLDALGNQRVDVATCSLFIGRSAIVLPMQA
jgi:hypothetical protein